MNAIAIALGLFSHQQLLSRSPSPIFSFSFSFLLYTFHSLFFFFFWSSLSCFALLGGLRSCHVDENKEVNEFVKSTQYKASAAMSHRLFGRVLGRHHGVNKENQGI